MLNSVYRTHSGQDERTFSVFFYFLTSSLACKRFTLLRILNQNKQSVVTKAIKINLFLKTICETLFGSRPVRSTVKLSFDGGAWSRLCDPIASDMSAMCDTHGVLAAILFGRLFLL